MPRIEFKDLLELYRHAQFGNGGGDDESKVTVATPAVADLLTRVDDDDYAIAETGVTLLDDLAKVKIDANVTARLDDPRSGFAVLAHDLDGLIKSPGGRIEEPKRFYLVDPPYTPGDAVVPDTVTRYRKVLALVQLFAEAASLLDATRSELVFVKEGKIVLPVSFEAKDLTALDMEAADRLLGQFADELHHDQKCSILFEALVEFCRAHKPESRFRFALRSLGDIADKVAAGYQLFASSFSYSKIKGELEDARIDYTQKIHRTIVDIQNQLLGIPVATIVVASQMKAPTACGPEVWVNFAVLVGAWIFVLMLVVAIINQWLTLGVIKDAIDQQQTALQRDFDAVSADFVGTFTKLKNRIWWHRAGLALVLAIGFAGGAVATYFDAKIAGLAPLPCPTVGAKPDAGTPTGTPSVPTSTSSAAPAGKPAAAASGPAATGVPQIPTAGSAPAVGSETKR
jgi:hypothetical protein